VGSVSVEVSFTDDVVCQLDEFFVLVVVNGVWLGGEVSEVVDAEGNVCEG
jgi:hypothetical protein